MRSFYAYGKPAGPHLVAWKHWGRPEYRYEITYKAKRTGVWKTMIEYNRDMALCLLSCCKMNGNLDYRLEVKIL